MDDFAFWLSAACASAGWSSEVENRDLQIQRLVISLRIVYQEDVTRFATRPSFTRRLRNLFYQGRDIEALLSF